MTKFLGQEISLSEYKSINELERCINRNFKLVENVEKYPNLEEHEGKIIDDWWDNPYQIELKDGHVEGISLIDLHDCNECEPFNWALCVSDTTGKDEPIPGKEDYCLSCGINCLPSSIIQLEDLKKLVVWGNSSFLNEIIPKSVGDLKNLEVLHLNHCSSEYMSEILSTLDYLKKLVINHYSIRDYITSIGKMKNIELLDLSNTNMDILPEDITNLKSLRILCLNKNNISTIPESISGLQSLEQLHLDDNRLSYLPDTLSNLEKLKVLSLDNNEPLRSLPENIGNLSSLKVLRIRNCALDKLPLSLNDLEGLETICLEGNPLSEVTHERATELVKSQKAKGKGKMVLCLNKEQASVISEIERITGEKFKYLEKGHQYAGMFMKTICQLNIDNGKIIRLVIGDTRSKLEELPESIEKLKDLEIFTCKGQNLISVPESLLKMEKLRMLDLSGNMLNELGSLENLKNLSWLNLDGNKLTDLRGIENLPNLTMVLLEFNNFSKIPNSFLLSKSLDYINLSFNPLEESEASKIKELEKHGEVILFRTIFDKERK